MPARPGRPHQRAGHLRLVAILYEQMFEDLPQYQLRQLETVWKTAAKAVHWRESLRYEISRAIAAGCTLEP
jgi:hypothetical protein